LIACVQRISETLSRTCPYTSGFVQKRYDAVYSVLIFEAKTGEELDRTHIEAEASKCNPAISIDKNATSSDFYAFPGEEINRFLDQYGKP